MTVRHLRHPYDVVHVHVPPDFHALALLLVRLTGARVILDIHDLTPELYADKFVDGQSSIVVRMLKLIEKLSCSMANHVIAANDLWRTTLINRSVSDNRCTAIINYPGPVFMRERKLLPQADVPLVLYPGTLSAHQGLSVALYAVRLLLDRNVQLHLAIYGRGPEEQPLRKLAQELELKNAFSLHPVLPLDQISAIMASATVGIVPKLAKGFGGQAFSTKILEFMAVGVPILVSATPIDTFYFNDSLVEFFKSGDAKDCAIHLERLLQDKELRASRIMAGRSFVAVNNWESKKSIYLDIVDSVTKCRYAP
jgi:glycosyltransferase involved in cell wall biosynthesis